MFASYGFEKEVEQIRSCFRRNDYQGMIEACTEEMVEKFAIGGTVDEVVKRVREYGDCADVIKLTPPTHHVGEEVTREAQIQILETFST